MTRILALDTSGRWGSLALAEIEEPGAPPRPVAEAGLAVERAHAAILIDWIDELLARAGWPRDSVDRYVATVGPGSFTGLRIGLGTVQGLALAAGVPAEGVGTLAAIAAAAGPRDRPRRPLLEAGRGEVYTALYDAAGDPPEELEPPAALAPADVPRGGADWIVPPGAAGALAAAGALDPAPRVVSGPRCVAAGAARLCAQGRAVRDGEPRPLAPLYVRPPDAVARPGAPRRER